MYCSSLGYVSWMMLMLTVSQDEL